MEVKQFCYLGDMLDCEVGDEISAVGEKRAIRTAVAAAWKREPSMLMYCMIGSRFRGKISQHV